jgi:hypothetical protein
MDIHWKLFFKLYFKIFIKIYLFEITLIKSIVIKNFFILIYLVFTLFNLNFGLEALILILKGYNKLEIL